MNQKEEITADENDYKEECIFTSIDIFSGPHNYLNFYYICEICFNDLSFVSPYHCYFFLRNQYESLEDVERNFTLNGNSSISKPDHLIIIKEKKATELFQYKKAIYYDETDFTDAKRRSLESLADVINALAISDLIAISPYFSENPEWKKHKLTWMDRIQRDKFRRYEKMRENLRETGKREIIYKVSNQDIDNMKNKNMVKDYFVFGVFEQKGQNHLGRIYMNIRNDILKNSEIFTWVLTNCNMQTDPNLVADVFVQETYFERSLTINNEVVHNGEDNDKPVGEKKKSIFGCFHPGTDGCYTVEEKTQIHSFLGKEFISFGKNDLNDIICLNPSISRFHCVLFFSKDYHLYLVDVGSKSRTKLNDKVCKILTKYKIVNNDIITLGVSKRTYKINIHIDKVLTHLHNIKSEVNKKMEIIHEEMKNTDKTKNKLKLKISNIYYKCNENDILDFFKNCGEIKNVRLYTVPFKGNENGLGDATTGNGCNHRDLQSSSTTNSKKRTFLKEALIDVYNEETSSKIMQKNECFLYGRKIYITYQQMQQHKSQYVSFNKAKEDKIGIQITCKSGKHNRENFVLKGERRGRERGKNDHFRGKGWRPDGGRRERDRIEKNPIERSRIEKSQIERIRIEKSPIERSRIEKSPIERSRIEKSSIERSRIEKSPIERSRIEKSPIERSRIEKSPIERSRIEKSPIERSRIEKSSIERSRIEKSPIERSRIEKSPIERSRIEKSPIERSRIEKSPIERSRIEKSSIERSRIEKSPIERSRIEKSPIERSRIEKSPIERSRIEKSPIERSRIEKSPIERSRIEKSKIERSRIEKSKTERSRIEKSQIDTLRGGRHSIGYKMEKIGTRSDVSRAGGRSSITTGSSGSRRRRNESSGSSMGKRKRCESNKLKGVKFTKRRHKHIRSSSGRSPSRSCSFRRSRYSGSLSSKSPSSRSTSSRDPSSKSPSSRSTSSRDPSSKTPSSRSTSSRDPSSKSPSSRDPSSKSSSSRDPFSKSPSSRDPSSKSPSSRGSPGSCGRHINRKRKIKKSKCYERYNFRQDKRK
ncbi:conserved Plasmodium protein, unknown function [Plasmodium ovale]|uniref:FHA domain-containing protein n=1 Tax=Plasmodium ovale TaxID=36330 RepID=A0A1D3TI96_PLAOA|nr:conserved Plasmodium protein, unknown function [Plasmodium ovale]